jgi:hypothetical protein
MPAKQHLVGDWFGEGAVEIDHHLGDPLLSRSHAPPLGQESQLFPN